MTLEVLEGASNGMLEGIPPREEQKWIDVAL